MQLSTLDLAIIILYFLGIVIYGWYHGRGQARSAEAYFMADRSVPWFLTGMALYATNMSGSSFIGLMGASYQHGLVVFNYEWTAALVLLIFAMLVLPAYIRSNITTVPEFLEKRYDGRSRTAFSVFTILAIIFIDTAGALYAGGIVIKMLLPEIELWQTIWVMGIAVGLYTILGGLSAVIRTDMIQAVLLFVGAALIFYVGLDAVGGWDSFIQQTDASKMTLVRPLDDPFLPWPGIFGVVILSFYYWVLNQFIAQRMLSARTMGQARKGALFAGLLKLPNLFLMILPGLFGLILYPDLAKADMIFPTLALDLLPSGGRGLVLTALAAAIMSSLAGALNAASTLITMDGVKRLYPSMSDEKLVKTGQWVGFAVLLFGMIYAPFIGRFQTLFDYVQSSLSYIVPPMVAVYLAGILSHRVTPTAALVALMFGFLAGTPLFLLIDVFDVWQGWGLPKLHYTYAGGIMFFAACLILAIVSFVTEKRPYAEIDHIVFNARAFIERWRGPFPIPWYADFRYQSVGLILLLALVIGYYW